MLFRQNSCRKSQKGVKMEVQKSQKGADDITYLPLYMTPLL